MSAELSMKPRAVDAASVCGLAAPLLGCNPEAKDVLVTYDILVAQRQSYVTPHVWYTAACGMLRVKPNKRLADFCKTIMYPNEGTPTTALDLSNSYLGVRGALALIVTLPLLGSSVRELRLSRCMLDTTLMVLLAQSITKTNLPDLFALDVSHNPCGSLGGEALAELVVRHAALSHVNIDGLEVIAPVSRKIRAVTEARSQGIACGSSIL